MIWVETGSRSISSSGQLLEFTKSFRVSVLHVNFQNLLAIRT